MAKILTIAFTSLENGGKDHPEKWIFYYPVGTKPGYPIPIARYIVEVIFFDKRPADLLIPFWRLFKKGETNNA